MTKADDEPTDETWTPIAVAAAKVVEGLREPLQWSAEEFQVNGEANTNVSREQDIERRKRAQRS